VVTSSVTEGTELHHEMQVVGAQLYIICQHTARTPAEFERELALRLGQAIHPEEAGLLLLVEAGLGEQDVLFP
jgi:hypothetical protein